MPRRNAASRLERKVCHDRDHASAILLRSSPSTGRAIFTPDWKRTEEERKVCLALEEVAKQVGVDSITAGEYQKFMCSHHIRSRCSVVAIAYVMQKTPYVFPIVGGRKVEHLMDNIAALNITLTPEQVKFLEDALPFKPGFPHEMIVSKYAFSCLRGTY